MKHTRQHSPGVKTLERDLEIYKEKSQKYEAKNTELTVVYGNIWEDLKRIEKERSEILLR